MKLKPLSTQVVVLMGASSGIGRETALQMAQQGAKLVISARSQSGLDSLAQEIRQAGGEVSVMAADVTQFEQVQRVAEHAAATYGQLDTWVHLAGVSLYATLEQTTPEEFKQVIDVNLIGQAYGAMAALPYLRQQERGALIHISSVEAVRALPYQSAYAASKHGVAGMVEAMRLELQHEGIDISVTNIMPASINTPFFNKARTKLGVQPKGLPPIYQPELVAEAILYAAENPVRDIFVGGAGKMIAMTQAISPKLMDMFLLQMGFEGQKTDQPKSEAAPDNLFGPIDGYDRVQGDFEEQAFAISPYTSMQTNPIIKSAATTLALLLTVVALRSVRR